MIVMLYIVMDWRVVWFDVDSMYSRYTLFILNLIIVYFFGFKKLSKW